VQTLGWQSTSRCGEPQSDPARDCRYELERLDAAGSLDLDKTLRA